MIRYFFDVTSDDVLVLDEEGSELDDSQAARAEAISILSDIAKGLKVHGNSRTFAVTARNTMGEPLFQATLSLTVAWS